MIVIDQCIANKYAYNAEEIHALNVKTYKFSRVNKMIFNKW